MKKIIYGLYDTAFGRMILGQTDRGLCWLGFMVQGRKGDGLERMKAFFPNAELIRDDASVKDLAERVLAAWEQGREADIPLDLQGTDFQCSVWKALLRIPRGRVKTYGEVANDIGRAKAVRAVGTAVGANPVSLIVPCHRVVPRSGGVGNYGWGAELKERLLGLESNSQNIAH